MEFGHVGRVVVADDEPVVRSGLRTSVESTGEFHVVAEAGDGHEAVDAVRTHLPDVLLLDLRMPRMNGVEATLALRAPGPDAPEAAAHIVLMTGFGLDADVERALAFGADAFLPKDAPREELLAVLRTVRDGDAVLPPRVLRQVLDASPAPAAERRRQARARLDALPPREAEVLGLVARGMSDREIGERLGTAQEAVRGLVGRLLAELGAANRVQLALLARAAGPGAAGPPR
ncbi:response regulator [Streptomyces sp. NPDC001903]|uniref:response regulator transcription factor n=1 Tax=Streptomyces sp. NPDC001903 TaxID=3364622 RepID=UPI0036C31192